MIEDENSDIRIRKSGFRTTNQTI